MNEILKIQNLTYRYPSYPGLDFPPLLKGIDFSLREGEFKIILGKPESGKSTLIKILLSLIPRYTGGEINGEVYYKGSPIEEYKPFELIEKIGAVFQDPDEQIFTTSCESEVAFSLESLGIERDTIVKRVELALKTLGISSLAQRNPATLSGGEKKKLLTACLYAVDPRIWLLDEIVDELDPEAADAIIGRLLKDRKTVILFSSKMLDIFNKIPAHVLVLSEGKLTDTVGMDNRELEDLLLKEGLTVNRASPWKKPAPLPGRESIVEISGLKYKYPDNDIFNLEINNFHLEKGEIIAIAGRNGSGKSTLGKIIAGLRQREGGTLTVKGEKENPCGYLFQNPDYQIFLPTVREELSLGLKLQDSEIEDVINRFSLPEEDVPPSLMSYGARKRLQGAVYYLLNRNIYILDEADAGLSLMDFENLIANLYRSNRGIIIISHNIDLCSRYADRIYLIDNGKIVQTFNEDFHNTLNTYFNSGEILL